MIQPADKETATVVMDTDEYEQKVTTVLSDDKMYVKLKKDPMQKYKRKLVSVMRKLKEDDKIAEEQYLYRQLRDVLHSKNV